MAIPENSAILSRADPVGIAGSLSRHARRDDGLPPYALYLYLVPLAKRAAQDPGPDRPEPATSI
ncbi:MAG: hypothetical protein ACLRWP_18620 [Bilophila wadsworthia]